MDPMDHCSRRVLEVTLLHRADKWHKQNLIRVSETPMDFFGFPVKTDIMIIVEFFCPACFQIMLSADIFLLLRQIGSAVRLLVPGIEVG